jgi:DNA (cytosine-5)-methyltransferase 1
MDVCTIIWLGKKDTQQQKNVGIIVMVLTIGTDCSGIEAPIAALEKLKKPFQHRWSCDNDPFVKDSITANYKPEIFFDDIKKRNHAKLPKVDLYVCGFPCQPFSHQGKKYGMKDARANIMLECISVIKAVKPKVFILENVKTFETIEDGAPYKYLISALNSIGIYNIHHDVYNTKDYGLPQHRERIYFVGIQKSCQITPFYKAPKQPCKKLESILQDVSTHNMPPKMNANKVINRLKIDTKKNYVVSCAGFGTAMLGCCPTITCTTPMYMTKYKRYLNVKELMQLQGFSPRFKTVVSTRQLRKQIGNAMSVNVLCAILNVIFETTCLVKS